jgi:predicted RNase H-like HicB family nuclease
MQTKALNFRILIEPELDERTGKRVYVAYCPTLGVSDWGKTVELAKAHIEEAIACHLESLAKHNKSIPAPDGEEFMVTQAHVNLSRNLSVNLAI